MDTDQSVLTFKLVRLKHNITKADLTKEQQEAIILLFKKPVPTFEVEFSDGQGRTIAELAPTRNQFDLMDL